MSNIERVEEALKGPKPRLHKFIDIVRAIGATNVTIEFCGGNVYAVQAPTGYGIIEERDKDLEVAIERGLTHLLKWRIR